jgi:hypothetical protein
MTLHDPQTIDRLVEQGVYALRTFHEEYEKDPTSRETEFRRGMVIGFRHTLHTFYGDYTSEIIDRVRQTANLAIPHAGIMTPDGSGYFGWDSDADMVVGWVE